VLRRKAGWLCVGLTAALLVGCGSGAKKRSTAEYRVQSIKKLIASLQSTFEKGSVEERFVQGGRWDRPDTRFAAMLMSIQKLQYNINKRVKDRAVKKKALDIIKQMRDYINKEVLPAYQKARNSRKPEDAKALVPMMQKLTEYMDQVEQALAG